MYRISFILILYLFTHHVQSQNASIKKDSTEVQNVISNLFDGMVEGDSIKVKKSLHKKVIILSSNKNRKNMNEIKEVSMNEFLNEIVSSKLEEWNEKIWNITIELEDSFARVWTNYSFYIDSQLSHCGVKSFQLVKETNENWKIVNIIDSKKKNGCQLL